MYPTAPTSPDALLLYPRHDGMPGLPGGPSGPSTPQIDIAEPPKDHIIWSLCCFVYMNPCCLGLAALIFSIKSRDRKVVSDLEGARRYASTARTLNLVATVIVTITTLTIVIVLIVVISQLLEYPYYYNNNRKPYYPYNY